MDINTCLATTVDSRSLALYANIVPAVTSIILAGFVLRRAIDRPKAYLFAGFVGVFAIWLLANSVLWNSNNYYLIAGLWTPLAYVELLFFLLLFCFFYLDIFSVIPRWMSAIVLLTASVSFIVNVRGKAASGFDQAWCNVYNSEFLNNYNLGTEVLILLAILGFGIYHILKLKENRNEQIRLGIITGSIVLFMGIFSGSEYASVNSTVYLAELYALFTLPIFILFLTIAITTYGTFRLGDTVAKALFYIFLVFSGAQFFFVTTPASFALAVIAFLMTLSFGVLLLQSYEREAEIRAKVELLAKELRETNMRQESLMHFIGHEVKGYLTKDASAFAALFDGDFGKLSEELKPFVERALAQSRDGARSVTDILTASNQKKGTVSYTKEPFDLKALVAEIVEKAKQSAEEKKLAISFTTADDSGAPYAFTGDKAKIGDNVLRNIIDNSINYTQSGSVAVSLKKGNNKIVFAVKDTGIGITEEDKKRLFTEGGHGKDSQKVNVHSTGYGLFIAKNIVEAHGGTIRAESEGAGNGSTFIVELPA
ncbi:HAMP domain-containing histidine kinase [Candidatus Kaiserbacteria bacterium]|nr:HAMP domain-containing histidine kinase [Candidatus Kaiserbacteria bacterium]